jgi:hypothetical protein
MANGIAVVIGAGIIASLLYGTVLFLKPSRPSKVRSPQREELLLVWGGASFIVIILFGILVLVSVALLLLNGVH